MQNRNTSTDSEGILNEILKLEPQYSLPEDFADMVANKAGRKFAWESYFKEFLIYLGVIAGILAVAAVMAFIWFTADLKEWTTFLLSNISWVAGINILVVFILFVDRVLLRYLFYKMSLKSA
ncbi:hypothetical protein [Maribellus maritimus]|uniref:hypothetical protein n=1 Tax=Maribellus maritimus TaxID=2870838 RepID=UPI001EEC1128|nr:hypothetical protein [Maribellus maritimus]MCG6190433.1 hypothetical protein [Maribellus maritimus]